MAVVSNNIIDKEQIGADVLLVAVTAVEIRAFFEAFDINPADARRYIGDKTDYDFAEVNGARTILVRSEMGAEGPAGSMLTDVEAVRLLDRFRDGELYD